MSEAVDVLDDGKKKAGIGEFVRETRAELDRTTFPSSDEVKKTTMIVIIAVLFFAVYLWAVDYFWIYALEAFTWLVDRIAGAI